jgi:hypothetical protein
MRFYYGYKDDAGKEFYSEITDKVFEIYRIEEDICIPCDDNLRANVFGDPYFGILKHILVKTENFQFTISHHLSVIIPINSQSENEIKIVSVKEIRNLWVQKIGKNIQDPKERLGKLHQWIPFWHGLISEEFEEQWMAITYLDPKDRVLELGGNYGRNSCLISSIMEDDKNLVVLETCQDYIPKLESNRKLNALNFQIEPSGLSKKKLVQTRWITQQWEHEVLPANHFWVPTITWSDLKQKYPIDFNVLVADCEGALFYILQDEPNFLDRFEKIIVENDYIYMEQYEFVKRKMEENGFKIVFNLGGGLSWHCCKDCFYQVWLKN